MVTSIGGSTSASTARKQSDIAGDAPASFRYNNPGAQYPSAQAALFGQIGYGVIGGGHKIARFPSPVNGAAANFDLLYRNYTGMRIGAAGTKWTGAHGFGVPGYDPGDQLTKQMLESPASAIALLKAIAKRESGRGNNLTEEQWRQAHHMFMAGSADAYLQTLPGGSSIRVTPGSKTGAGLVKRARQHLGEDYRNVLVPKNDSAWKGPWDCAEFISWLVYQEAGVLYGCEDNDVDPSRAEAYTGAWKRDVERLGRKVSVDEAVSTVGGIVLRYPPGPGKMGHIALCDGHGGTIEAKGRRYGVVADTVDERHWDTGILVPGIIYETGSNNSVRPPVTIYRLGASNMDQAVISRIQMALLAKGYNPGAINGQFLPATQAAIADFQEAEGLVVDGEVGPETADALGISLAGDATAMVDQAYTDTESTKTSEPAAADPLLLVLATLLLSRFGKADGSTNAGPSDEPSRSLLQLVMQSLTSGRQIQSTDLVDFLDTARSGGPVSKPGGRTAAFDMVATLMLPILYERVLGKPVSTGNQEERAQQPASGQTNVSKPSVQLGIAGLGVSSILQALGILGTPFGMGAAPTTAGTLATLASALVGVFGATNGFGALQGIGRAILGIGKVSPSKP